MPRAAAVPNLVSITTTRTADGFEGNPPPHYRVAEMEFESPEAMAESAGSEEWATMRACSGDIIERFGGTMIELVASVEKTGRALVVHEAVRTAGPGAEIAARIQEPAFFALDAPVWRLGALDTPVPQSPDLEQLVIPGTEQIVAAARELAAI